MCDNIWVKCRLFRCLQLTEERDKLSAELEKEKQNSSLLHSGNHIIAQEYDKLKVELESAKEEIDLMKTQMRKAYNKFSSLAKSEVENNKEQIVHSFTLEGLAGLAMKQIETLKEEIDRLEELRTVDKKNI
jgi:seryl-tRNA synthetase